MLSNRRQDGAVHIAFLIITIIIALAGWTMWYLANKDFEETTKQMKAKTVEVEAKNDAFIRSLINGPKAPANPWGAATLEWKCSSPPPHWRS